MSNPMSNKVTKKALREALKRTDFGDSISYEQFLRQQLSKQMTADLLEIAELTHTPIPKMIADKKGIFRELKT